MAEVVLLARARHHAALDVGPRLPGGQRRAVQRLAGPGAVGGDGHLEHAGSVAGGTGEEVAGLAVGQLDRAVGLEGLDLALDGGLAARRRELERVAVGLALEPLGVAVGQPVGDEHPHADPVFVGAVEVDGHQVAGHRHAADEDAGVGQLGQAVGQGRRRLTGGALVVAPTRRQEQPREQDRSDESDRALKGHLPSSSPRRYASKCKPEAGGKQRIRVRTCRRRAGGPG